MSGEYEFEPYEAKDGWRWRLNAGNNFIVADSSESYDSEFNVNRAIEGIKSGLGVLDREQFLVIRREHWTAARERYAPSDDAQKFANLVEEASI